MSVQSEELKERTMSFAVAVLRLIDKLPPTAGNEVIARQLAKSATSVGANYRGCCNARSRQEFIAKMGIVVEESEESVYWLDLLSTARLAPDDLIRAARTEAVELRAIFARSLGTARRNSMALKPPGKIRESMTK
jgi:four helix bundle protein